MKPGCVYPCAWYDLTAALTQTPSMHLVLAGGGRRGKSAGQEEEEGSSVMNCTVFTVHAKISAHIEMQLQTTEAFKSLLYFPVCG